MRQTARNDELFLILLAVVAGAVAAVGVIALRELVVLIHHYLYGVPAVEHALQDAVLQWWRPVAVLGAGGVAYGLAALLIRRWRPIDPLDVIEANALHGGNLPLWDGLIIAFLTVTAVGLGASVGLEAGVTQLGAAAASWMGRRCKMNRTAMRTLVGCGAAAAIAAAFNAPIAGIFYALELVIGGYAVTALIPVAVAGITGTLTAHLMFDVDPIYFIVTPPMLNSADYGLFALLGVAAAAVGVIVMRLATTVEAILKRAHIPGWLRPGIGGLALAAIGYSYPQVLGSGHGALDATLNGDVAIQLLLALLAAKALASAISIGSGFRGGLFSASLLLGSLLGSAYWSVCFYLFPTHIAVHSAYAVVGIGAVAASVIGAPLTMILLVFETTSDYTMTVGVAVGVMVATVDHAALVRLLLFHLALPSARRAAEGRLRCRPHVRHDRAPHPGSRRADGRAPRPGSTPWSMPCSRPASRWPSSSARTAPSSASSTAGGAGEAERKKASRRHRGEPWPTPGQSADARRPVEHRAQPVRIHRIRCARRW